METRCHLGQVIRLDTVQKLGWSVDVRTHGIKAVIDRLLGPNSEWPFDDDEKGGDGGDTPEGGIQNILKGLWPWPGKKDGEGEGDDGPSEPKIRRLPPPKPAGEVEGEDGVCSVCSVC